MNYLIGIDLGTSGTKTVLFNENGEAIASATQEYPLYQPQNGWLSRIRRIGGMQCLDAQAVIVKAGWLWEAIAGIGISGQMHGLVMLDQEEMFYAKVFCGVTGVPGRMLGDYGARGQDRLIQITANPALTGFTASKILWVRKHEPELYARCRHILLPKDYIRYQLTGVFATDVSDAPA
ncbi:MAG: FGGY family carbohydrate kinase [Hydrogeniiclostridium mannosilyticum]